MVVTQLVEQWLLTPEIRDSNPVIGKFYFPSTVLKDEKKRGRECAKVFKIFKNLRAEVVSWLKDFVKKSNNGTSRRRYRFVSAQAVSC